MWSHRCLNVYLFLIKIYTCNKSEARPRWCHGYCALGHTVQGKSQRDYCGSWLKWRSKGKYKNNSNADGWKKKKRYRKSWKLSLRVTVSCAISISHAGHLIFRHMIQTILYLPWNWPEKMAWNLPCTLQR